MEVIRLKLHSEGLCNLLDGHTCFECSERQTSDDGRDFLPKVIHHCIYAVMNHPRSRVDYIIWNSLEIFLLFSPGSSYSIRVMKDAKKFNKEPDITTSRVSTTSSWCSSPALWCSQRHRPVPKVKHNLCWHCTAQQLVFFVDTALKISLCAAHILSVYLYTLFEIIVFSVFRVQIFKRCYKKSQPSVCTDVNWAYRCPMHWLVRTCWM